MSDSLKEVIAKMKSQQSSPKSKIEDEKKKDFVKEVKEGIEQGDFGEDETPEEKKAGEESELQKQAEAEIKLLEDDGRFRAELLFQLNEMRKEFNELNKAMVVIADILVQKK